MIRKTEPIGKTVESLRKARARFDEVALNVALMEGVNDAQADVEALARVGDPDWVIVIGALMTDRGAKVHPKAGEIEARLNELGRKTRRLEAVARAICEQGAFARLASNVR